jgi:NAD(P)-dependent dehydrogenase (short-subunit alcohol dehydrogenase family)
MRALRNTAAKFNISINCVAPWVTETNLLQPGLRDRLAVSRVPIQKAESVATAIAYSVTAESWTGKTIFCCDDTFTEVEGPILELLPQWLGEENARLWNNAQETPYFVSKSGL